MVETLQDFVFFLPTRKGSERVQHKNTRKFAGIEGGLVQLKLKQLLEVPDVPILLSTNDPETIRIAKKFDNERIILKNRPDELCLSTTNLQDLINYIPSITQAQHIIWTHVTSPFVEARHYKRAIELYHEALQNAYDSLMSVTKINEFLWDKEAKSIANYDRSKIKWPRTQDLKSLYAINSGIFINSRDNYLNLQDRIGKHPYLMELKTLESIDIDWEDDFLTAEKIYAAIKEI